MFGQTVLRIIAIIVIKVFAGIVSEIQAGPSPLEPPGPLALRSAKESWAQWSLRRGMESLPEALAEFLQRSGKVELHLNAPVTQIDPSAAGWKVRRKPKCVALSYLL